MSVMDRIKGLVLEETAPAAALTNTASTNVVASTVYVGGTPPSAQADPEIRKLIANELRAIDSHGLNALDNMMTTLAVIPDEGMRIKAAIAAIKATGHTFDGVLGDINACFKALDQKVEEDAAAVEQALKTRVGVRTIEREKLSARSIELRDEIAKIAQQMMALDVEIAREKAQITETHEKVVATVNAMRDDLAEKRAKLLAHGKEA